MEVMLLVHKIFIAPWSSTESQITGHVDYVTIILTLLTALTNVNKRIPLK